MRIPDLTACSILAGSCPDDRVTTFYGASSPVVLCGRHAAGMSPADWSTLHKAGRVVAPGGEQIGPVA